MLRANSWVRVLVCVVAVIWMGLSISRGANLPSTGLVGVVKSTDGKPIERVAVSAQGHGKTFSTSVYTDRDGEYYFPPLETGQYRIRAQAVGFEQGRAAQAISPGKK